MSDMPMTEAGRVVVEATASDPFVDASQKPALREAAVRTVLAIEAEARRKTRCCEHDPKCTIGLAATERSKKAEGEPETEAGRALLSRVWNYVAPEEITAIERQAAAVFRGQVRILEEALRSARAEIVVLERGGWECDSCGRRAEAAQ